jgi:hypothetical protein
LDIVPSGIREARKFRNVEGSLRTYSGDVERVKELGYGVPPSGQVGKRVKGTREGLRRWTKEEMLTLAMANEDAEVAWSWYESGDDKHEVASGIFGYGDETPTLDATE